MKIWRLSLKEGSLSARGLTVIIDVFRAFTCEPLLYHYGAKSIILEPDIQRCLDYQGKALLIGEHNEKPIDGFDLTNSPSIIMTKGWEYFTGRDIVHRTTSGVTGAAAALSLSDDVLLASFVNASATAYYIKHLAPELVSIVAMGSRSAEKAPEDEFCGDYIESMLNGKQYDHIRALDEILTHETAQKFIRGDKEYLPQIDPAICLQCDLFDFALRAVMIDGQIMSIKIPQDDTFSV